MTSCHRSIAPSTFCNWPGSVARSCKGIFVRVSKQRWQPLIDNLVASVLVSHEQALHCSFRTHQDFSHLFKSLCVFSLLLDLTASGLADDLFHQPADYRVTRGCVQYEEHSR